MQTQNIKPFETYQKTYEIFSEVDVDIPWNSGYNRIERKMNLSYDNTKTRIVSASAFVRTVVGGNCYVTAKVKLNDNVLVDHKQDNIQEHTVDVSTMLFNGSNFFSGEVWKGAPPCYFPVWGRFTLALTITYEGEEPKLKPPFELPDIPWWGWALIVVGGFAGAVTVLPRITKKRPPAKAAPTPPPIIVVR